MELRGVREAQRFAKRVGSMDTERLADAIRKGALGPVAERAAMAELAGRVLADEVDYTSEPRGGAVRVLEWVPVGVAAIVFVVWLARMLGVFR